MLCMLFEEAALHDYIAGQNWDAEELNSCKVDDASLDFLSDYDV